MFFFGGRYYLGVFYMPHRHIVFIARWRSALCACDIKRRSVLIPVLSGWDSDTRRASFGGASYDAHFLYDGEVYIATTSIIVSLMGLFYMTGAFCSSADGGDAKWAYWMLVIDAFL